MIPPLTIDGVAVPRFLYGTAWKEAETRRLVELALAQGFRGIDTANQRKHYYEEAVGQALTAAIRAGAVRREELFIQTKFTFRGGQDHRLPYDAGAPIAKQVEQSFASSLVHLGIDSLDSYVLHGPSRKIGLGPDDWEAWRAMESLHAAGKTRFLGISNVSLEQLEQLCRQAHVQPRFVQNRCYAIRRWDRPIRDFCASRGILYQGFSLLTANRDALTHPAVMHIAKRYNRTPSQIIFRFALDVGMIALTGTSSAGHMQEDLGVDEFTLTADEIRKIEECCM